jgi:ribosomal protein L3 glutamine methyltransferase
VAVLAIAYVNAFPEAEIAAMDITNEVLVVTKRNIQVYCVEHQVILICFYLFRDVPTIQYDLIITNPQYVDAQDISDLP